MMAQQPKSVAVKTGSLDSKPPSSLAFGSPREALFCGGGKNSSRFSVTQTIPAFIRSPALRSATLQRVLKPKITGMKVWFFDS